MAECDVPSFSLGLDFSLDDTPPPSPSPNHVSDSDPDTRPDPPRRILKRLRRGPSSSTVHHQADPDPDPEPEPPSTVHHQADPETEPPSYIDVDEDIEEFSSQDDPVTGYCLFNYLFYVLFTIESQMYVLMCKRTTNCVRNGIELELEPVLKGLGYITNNYYLISSN